MIFDNIFLQKKLQKYDGKKTHFFMEFAKMNIFITDYQIKNIFHYFFKNIEYLFDIYFIQKKLQK